MSEFSRGLSVHVEGIVQGVGFRPFVYKLAKTLGLRGWVRNTSSGVDILIMGHQMVLDDFLHQLTTTPPPLAHIDNITTEPSNYQEFADFSIIDSRANESDFIPISPDMSICLDCTHELFDPRNRRFRYPFINCTNCGPRFSIIKDIPYDRPLTTMSEFHMCPDCEREYRDPADRRYHAQPIACPTCGPKLYFHSPDIGPATGENALSFARSALRDGKILALKGLGGYHLVCDAHNQVAISNLRQRKLRSEKPFALMAFDTSSIRRYVEISPRDEELLISPQHPIVLLSKKPGNNSLDHTAPSQQVLGFMLPYTPLHLLILEPAADFPDVLVMTSGNLSEEPIAYLDSEAHDRLEGIADCFLYHDRPIQTRVDDSVFRVVNESEYPVRRARGYAPVPLRTTNSLAQVFACGPELKNTFALSRNQYVFISHHIGDMENLETLDAFTTSYEYFKKIFRVDPQTIAVDMHPDYLSTRFGEKISEEQTLPLVRVQHHHAHLASCLADNQIDTNEPVIGLLFDGTGYGTDGHIWGGEVFVGNYHHFERRYHLQEVQLPGGDSSIRNPSKISLAYLFEAGVDWDVTLPPVLNHSFLERDVIKKQLQSRINCVPTSSMGRLFDAVSSLIGLRHKVTYEGQAAIELENLVDPMETGRYLISHGDGCINTLDLIPQIIGDLNNKIEPSKISAKFHNTIAWFSNEVCQVIRSESGLKRVALSGGVWQNITLLSKTSTLLEKAGFEVLIHHRVPTNDGGISLGQIMVANSSLESRGV